MRERPGGFAQLALALRECLAPPRVLVLRGEREALGRWQAGLVDEYLPDTLVLAIENGVSGLPPALDKPARPEPVNGWLCRGVTCLAPISSLEDLLRACKAEELR
jgi:uncharacterized protein YyaL (SSP411 family)